MAVEWKSMHNESGGNMADMKNKITGVITDQVLKFAEVLTVEVSDKIDGE